MILICTILYLRYIEAARSWLSLKNEADYAVKSMQDECSPQFSHETDGTGCIVIAFLRLLLEYHRRVNWYVLVRLHVIAHGVNRDLSLTLRS